MVAERSGRNEEKETRCCVQMEVATDWTEGQRCPQPEPVGLANSRTSAEIDHTRPTSKAAATFLLYLHHHPDPDTSASRLLVVH